MKDQDKAKTQLINELISLRQEIAKRKGLTAGIQGVRCRRYQGWFGGY